MRYANLARCWRVAIAAIAVVACGGVAGAAAPAPAALDPCVHAPDDNHLVADATHPGVIDLAFYNANGARVVFFECLRGGVRRLAARRSADPAGPTLLEDATTWSCNRRTRRFAGAAIQADGTVAFGAYSVHTVSCASRFELHAPRRVKPGAKATVRVVDRWGIGGIRPQLCIAPAPDRPRCRTLAFPRAVTVASRRFRATTRGRWRVELRVRRYRVRTSVAVGGVRSARPAPAPTLLATGDSTMQGIDSFLADELGDAASVHSDVRPGTGVSRGNYWLWHAASQTKRLRQRVTVMSVGAATDAVAMPTPAGALVACCDEEWVREYSRRVRIMMQTYLRGGRARVIWLTPPEPRYPPRAAITHAVDAAVVRAAEGLAGVKVLRIDLMFSPDGYRDVIRYRGRDVRVRESDGVHLNVPGTAIAARAVARAIREG
jgi:hypothetical protein